MSIGAEADARDALTYDALAYDALTYDALTCASPSSGVRPRCESSLLSLIHI